MTTVVLVLAFMFASVLPRQGAEFRGKTSQGETVSFTVSRGEPRLLGLVIRVGVRCPRFAKSELRRFPPLPVRRDGGFTGVSRDVPRGLVPQGDFAWLYGRFVSSRRATGTLVLVARTSDPSFGIASCTSRVSWTARTG